MTRDDIETMTEGYLAAALFTDLPEGEVGSGEFNPSPYSPKVASKTRKEAREVCTRFFDAHSEDLSDYPARDAGMDLWYSRNGHGCGFFEDDHTEPPIGDRLQSAAEKLGERHLFRIRGGWFVFDL